MTNIVLAQPTGIFPKVASTDLADNACQTATNTRFDTGDMHPLNSPSVAASNLAKGAPQSIFRITYLGTPYFLHWTTDVDAQYVMADSDESGTIVFTGEDEPAVCTEEMAVLGTDTRDGINVFPGAYVKPAGHYPRAAYTLGVPFPLQKPYVTVSGTASGKKQSSRYRYTWGNAWNQESKPSPVSDEVVGTEDQDFTLTGIEDVSIYGILTGSGEFVTYVRNMTPDGFVYIYPATGRHFIKDGHKFVISGATGSWAAINGTWTADKAKEIVEEITALDVDAGNEAKLYIANVGAFEVGDYVFARLTDIASGIDDIGGVVISLSFAGGYIVVDFPVAITAGAKTKLTTDAYVVLGRIGIPISTATASGYTAGSALMSKSRPYNFATGIASDRVKSFVRVYRQTGTDPNYYLIIQRPINLSFPITSLIDSKRTAKAVRLVSEGWDLPPGGLKGIKANPQGYMMGFIGKTVYLSEFRAPYAWPSSQDLDYRQPTKDRVIAIGITGGAAVVLTKGQTYIGAGSHPGAFQMQLRPHVYPCRSKKSVVSTTNGVIYSSDYGYVIDGPTFPQALVLTENQFDKWTWDKDVIQQSVVAMYYRGALVTFWAAAKGHILKNGVLSTHTETAACVYTDPETGLAFFANGDDVYQWEGDAASFKTQIIRSKKFRLPLPASMSALQVFGDFVQPRTATADTVTVRVYEEGTLWATKSVTSSTPVRLPSPQRWREYEIEIECKSRVQRVVISTNMTGLKQI